LLFDEGLLSSFVFYFGEDIFHKVNWVASLGQTYFKVVQFLLFYSHSMTSWQAPSIDVIT